MAEIDKVLAKLEHDIANGEYLPIETERLELKDLSTGTDWKELHKSVCAFLNTEGGIAIIGIHENDKGTAYRFTGFDPKLESKLKELPKLFKDYQNQPLDLSDAIRPTSWEIKDFMNGKVALLYIEKLPEDQKYAFYEGIAYQRELTGDKKIPKHEIDRQNERREDLLRSRELQVVKDATTQNLDVDKLNDYILRLNSGGPKVESVKADIGSAHSFLERRKFTLDGIPTLLGMLICAARPYDFLEARCQVDCFVESPVLIAGNKRVLKDNVIPLMENSFGFVISNIARSVSTEKGGTQYLEYPERLIREIVNNALAHRDYSINEFVNITITPGQKIEVKNPGRFRAEHIVRKDAPFPVRHIIPITKAQNPRLADALKIYDRWEGKGYGMASITNMALENEIDVAYYLIRHESVALTIQKGKVLDDRMKGWLRSFAGFILSKTNGTELSEEEQTALAYFYKCEELNRMERFTVALTPDNNHFGILSRLSNWQLIEKTNEDQGYYPIFSVNRTLVQTDFNTELRSIFGGAFEGLKSEGKNVLTVVYRFQHFGHPAERLNAAQIGDFLYFSENREIANVKAYNDFKRKIRKVVNDLVAMEFLSSEQGGKKAYRINNDFQRTPSIFD